MHLAHRIQQPIPKLRIQIVTKFLTNCNILIAQKTRENSGFVVSAFVVGFAEQDIWYQGFRKRKQKRNLTK